MSQDPMEEPNRDDNNPWDAYMDKPQGQESHSSEEQFHSSFGILFAIAVTLGLMAIVAYLGLARGMFHGADGKMELAYAFGLCLLVGVFALNMPRHGYGKTFKQVLLWVGIFLACILAYAYRGELGAVKDRVMAALVPGQGLSTEQGTRSFEIADDGHFYIQALVEGKPVLFLADTGATSIVLTKRDAKRLGLDLDSLDYNGYASTANGIVRVATIHLGTLNVGEFSIHDFKASVNDSELDISLLGMDFFSRLQSYGVAGDVLTIKWDQYKKHLCDQTV